MSDVGHMRLALAEATKALAHDDVPVGAVVVRRGSVVAAAHNERELRADPTAHAEILALRAAASAAGSWRLDGVSVFVTLEPCVMCAGAIVQARAARLIYGPQDPKAGAAFSLYNVPQDPRLNHIVEVVSDVLAEESRALLGEFFETRRRPEG
ncbi:MAG: tRNA adenosine(34) deaminase TadA [Actinomycetota bacterium]